MHVIETGTIQEDEWSVGFDIDQYMMRALMKFHRNFDGHCVLSI
jgi:hypothetical protein